MDFIRKRFKGKIYLLRLNGKKKKQKKLEK